MEKNVFRWASTHWPVLVACITFVAGLWLSSKVMAKDIESLERRVATLERIDDRLRSIENQVVELKILVKLYAPNSPKP